MSFHYYVYYKIDQARAAQAAECVQALLHEVRARTGVGGRVVRGRDDPLTWMEIYENVERAAEFEETLARAVASTDFGRLLAPAARRHTECFVTLPAGGSPARA